MSEVASTTATSITASVKKPESKKIEKEKPKVVEVKEVRETLVLPKIIKPPIFESKQQLINFFSQPEIAALRPLGKIVGLEIL